MAALPLPGSLTAALEQVRKDLLAKGIVVSDRRFGWAGDLLTAHAFTPTAAMPISPSSPGRRSRLFRRRG